MLHALTEMPGIGRPQRAWNDAAKREAVGLLAAAIAWLGCVAASAQDGPLSGVETWAYRRAVPAVVNPAVRSPKECVLSLRGAWEFVTQGVAPSRHPAWVAFYAKPWPGSQTLAVPGCWEAQGVGKPGMGDSWDCKWDHGAKPLRHIYQGEAWYRKSVEVPLAWRGKRVWLKVGGVRSQGWFWVNGKTAAWVDSYCGTYKYDVTDLVEAGQPAVVVAAVNNVLPSRKGQFVATHRFGGLYRDVELEATPDMRIDDAWVRGDFDHQTAEVHATIACATPAGLLKRPVLLVAVTTAEGRPAGSGSQPVALAEAGRSVDVACRVPLAPFRPWSPESPSLYRAELTLSDGDAPIHGRAERFGVRKIEVRGKRFFLNDKPIFLRGFGDDSVYPLSLVSPASKEEHLKHLNIARAAGFNYVRCHTHCEWPEYYEAADEAGIMVQPELPYYGDYPTEAFCFDPMRDLVELYRHYRRYVSFTTYCTGNEGLLGKPLDKEIYKLAKRLDPNRLVLHQDGGVNTAENSDFRSGPINVWEPGSFRCDAPFVAHEYLNLSVKQDARLEPRFSGVMLPPVTMAARDRELAAAGLDRRWGDAIQDAAHALQRCYQKRGIEAARLDPACCGYDYWTIVDVIIQQGSTYTAQGLFNAFWEPKSGGTTPEFFRQFNGPTALLLKTQLKDPIAVSGEVVKAGFWITHYGDARLQKPQLRWTLRAGPQVFAGGQADCDDVELGSTQPLAEVPIAIPAVAAPVRAVLEADSPEASLATRGTSGSSPSETSRTGAGSPSRRHCCPPWKSSTRDWSPPSRPTRSGRNCSSLQATRRRSCPRWPPGNACWSSAVPRVDRTSRLGWWSMENQVGTALAKHPALGDFPHEGYLSPLAFRILKTGVPLPLAGMRPDDVFVVGEGRDKFFLYAGQARCDRGRLLICVGLDLLSGTPEGTCLLDGLIRHARSEAFQPKGVVRLPFRSHSGWQRTIAAGDTGRDQLLVGTTQIDVARAMNGKNVLIWETQPVPAERPHPAAICRGLGRRHGLLRRTGRKLHPLRRW